MFDMDEMRVPNGTVADFSNWKGVRADGNFKPMKITSSEKIIEPVEEQEIVSAEEQPIIKRKMDKTTEEQEIMDKTTEEQEIMDNFPTPPKLNNVEDFAKDSIAKKKVERSEMPGVQQAYLNPNELKEIAIKLMPTIDKLTHNIYEPISIDAMRNVSEAAINMAFEFLKVWNEKVSIGE